MMNNLSLNSPGLRQARPGPPKALQLSNIQSMQDGDRLMPLSPDMKRRRYNNGTYMITPSRPGIDTPHPFTQQSNYTREPLPRPDQLLRASPGSPGLMGPPPHPGHMSNIRPHDASLTLPPLQTAGEQIHALEQIVATMPYLGKIKVLGRIAPPLRSSSFVGSAANVRGAIVAVEGSDAKAVRDTTARLEELLNKSGEHFAKIARPPKVPGPEQKEASLADYLEMIKEWHAKSKEMIDFLTSAPPPLPQSADGVSPRASGALTPILLVPTFQLHASDAYASRIPINDTYTPADHWQWMATMWRGIVGPDITIYIKNTDADEMAREKLVDVREDVRCFTVRKDRDAAGIDGRALRRVAFEVGECVSSISPDV